MVLGKLPVPGRPTDLDYSRAWAYCTFSRCGGGCLDIFSLVYHFSFPSPSLGWLVGCFGLNDPLRQYFSLYRVVSQRERERQEKWKW